MNLHKVHYFRCLLWLSSITACLDGHAQSLPIHQGLKLWLKAGTGITTNAGGEVVLWGDQSGLHNDASQTNPASAPELVSDVINGHAVLHFSGDRARFLVVPDSPSIAALTNDVTILTVASYTDLSAYRCIVTKAKGNIAAPFDWWNDQTMNDGRTTFWLGDGLYSAPFISDRAPPIGVYNVISFSWRDGALDQYLNGSSDGHFAYTVRPADAGLPLLIGSRQDQLTQLKGNLAEVLIYQPSLTGPALQAVTAYLRDKYAIAFHSPPTVSITTPTDGATTTAPADLPVSVTAAASEGVLTQVDLIVNQASLASWQQPPYKINLGLPNPGTLVISAVALDQYGYSNTSAPVSIVVTGTGPTTPPLSGLKVWLRADAGVTTNSLGRVIRWIDQSGNGNDATQSDSMASPNLVPALIHGLPALHFTSTNMPPYQCLNVPATATAFTTNDFTTFVMARFADFDSYRTLWTLSLQSRAAPFDWWFSPTPALPYVYRGNGSTYSDPVLGINPAPAGSFAVFGVMVSGTQVTHYLNSSPNGTGTASSPVATAGEPLRIGSRSDGVTQMQGDIAEVLIYDHALSAIERSNAIVYLDDKYGLVHAFNANQPPLALITGPTNGTSFAALATFPLTVAASDPDGRVTRVDILDNNSILTSLNSAPYDISLQALTPGTATLRAVAVDNWGARGTSSPIVLMIASNAPTVPPTKGLALWLKADAGVTLDTNGALLGWADQSGQGNNAYQTSEAEAPIWVPGVLNGKPALRFDAGTPPNYLLVSNSPSIANLTTNFSAVVVAEADDFGNAAQDLLSKTISDWPRPFDWLCGPAPGHPGQPELMLASAQMTNPLNMFQSWATQTLLPDQFYVLGISVTNGTVTHYLNSDMNGQSVFNFLPEDGGGPLFIGNDNNLNTPLNGEIAEILVYNPALSESQRRQVFGYLSAKYGIAQVRVANAPPTVTITNPPNGSSITVPGLFDLTAQVADSDDTITNVLFLADQTVLASETAPPFQVPIELLSAGTIDFRAQATDVRGATATSAPVTVTLTGNLPSAPPRQGLLLWLKADAGVTTNHSGLVLSWADQSGQGHDAVQPDPALAPSIGISPETGEPVLVFDGASRYLDVSGSTNLNLGDNISSFFAGSFADFKAYRAIWGMTVGNLPQPWDFYVSPERKLVLLRGNNRTYSWVVSTNVLIAARLLTAGFTAQASSATLYMDGQIIGSGSFRNDSSAGGTPLRIGSRDDLLTQFAGTLSEILIYDHSLSPDELTTLNEYLAGRYHLLLLKAGEPARPALIFHQTTNSAFQLAWPASPNGLVLETRTSPTGGPWIPVVTNPPAHEIFINPTNATQFFRLRFP